MFFYWKKHFFIYQIAKFTAYYAPLSLLHYYSFAVFSLQLTVNINSVKIFQWLDSNRWHLVSESAALPTEPQPMSEKLYLLKTLYFNKLDGKLESFCVIKLVKWGEPFFSMNRSVISSIRFRCLVLWRDDCAEISHLFPVSSFWISFFGFTMNLLTKSPKPLKVKNVSDLKRKFIEQNGERER